MRLCREKVAQESDNTCHDLTNESVRALARDVIFGNACAWGCMGERAGVTSIVRSVLLTPWNELLLLNKGSHIKP